jgi:MFS family permease
MKKKIFYGWWIVAACFLISFYVGGVIFYGLTAFLSPLREEFGWSYTQISLASSLRGLEMGVFSPLIGILVDRLGPRRVILWGTITVGLGIMLLAFTRSLAMLYGAFLLLAFGAGGCTSVALMSAVTNWFKKNVGKALGLMASGFGASGLIVPVIVLLIHLYGWRNALILLGLGMWVIGIPCALVIRDHPEQYGYYPDDEGPPEQASEGGPPSVRKISFREALKHTSFIYLNLTESMRLMILSAVVLHIMPYLDSVGVARSTAGFVAAAVPLFSIIGRLGLGWLGDHMDKRHALAISFGLMVLGMLSLSFAERQWIILPFLLFFSPGFGGSTVLRGSILRENFGREYFGKLIGIIMGSAAVGGIFGPTLAGWVYDTLGDYRPVWVSFSILSCLAIGVAFMMKPAERSNGLSGEPN